MCGLLGIVGAADAGSLAARGIRSLEHRGPDAEGLWTSPGGDVALAHRRLSIIDLSAAGVQPMTSPDGTLVLVFNGEIYNYVELRRELEDYPFRTGTDTEVILAAYARWGEACLDRFLGMFAFAIWNTTTQTLFAARDRFGVKPLFVAELAAGGFALASEIKALHGVGVVPAADEVAWASYLATGSSDAGERTFWQGVRHVPAGYKLFWQRGVTRLERWYDIVTASGLSLDERPDDDVAEEYLGLLLDAVRLRFRADVPVGINLSGGLDSSTLLAAVHAVQGPDSDVSAFTFVTGEPDYDEITSVDEMLGHTHHRSVVCRLSANDVPSLAEDVQRHQDEPFGGIPTLAYAALFEQALDRGVTVLLDGQGMDEQLAGYDYYRRPANVTAAIVQGTSSSPTRSGCLSPDLLALAGTDAPRAPFDDALRNTQLRDLTQTKLPRALRYNDRVSMRSSTELREPFLDHRLVELALRQPPERKIDATTGKVLLRQLVGGRLPGRVVEAPKRGLQTPQREWLRGPLRRWVTEVVHGAMDAAPDWFLASRVRDELTSYFDGEGDNSYFIWQWVSVGLLLGSSSMTSRSPAIQR